MTYTLPASFREQYRAYRTAFHRKTAAWLGYVFFVGLPLLIAALAVVVRGWTVQEVWTQQGYLLVLGPLLVIVGLPLLHRLNVQQQRSGNATAVGEQTIEFSADGFRTWGVLHNTSVLWSGIHGVVETRRYFLIYLSEVDFFFLPKAAVTDTAELRRVLREHLADRARLAA